MSRRYITILKEAAQEIFASVHGLLGTSEAGRIVGKGYGGDKTKYVDYVAEEAVVSYLERNGVSCTFIGEESGVRKIGGEPSFYLITDVVDGTNNAIRGIRFVSTSIAASPTDRLEDVEAAVVMNLWDGDIYEAEKGKGAQYNDEVASPSGVVNLEDSFLSIDVARSSESVGKVVPHMKRAKSVRSFGSAALEICLVASGHVEAYVDLRGKLRTLDFAASMLVLQEAGGTILQPNGEGFAGVPLTKMNHFSIIAAANQSLYKEIVSLIPDS